MPPMDERRYQVFVSSTFRDLQDERQHALQAILEMGCFPSGMELFPSADDEQWEFIRREIASSDYYVVILAGKYGSLAPDGFSFTEKEYDFAVSIGKPVMGFLHYDLSQLTGSHLELDSDRRSKLEAFHAKAKAGKLVKFYKNSHELKAQIWQALTHSIALRPGEGWVRGRNGRRLGDLEAINALRAQVIQLERELAELRRSAGDPESLLARDNDAIEFPVTIRANDWSPSRVNGPGSPGNEVEFILKTSWDETLRVLFHEGTPTLDFSTVRALLDRLCVNKAVELNLLPGDQKSLVSASTETIDGIAQPLAVQFSGLGYLNVYVDPRTYTWSLTQKGKLQLALMLGKRRNLPAMGGSVHSQQ